MIKAHLEFAIAFEERLIRLREGQIRGYRKRIDLMKSGNSYDSVLKAIPAIPALIKFDKKEYYDLKKKE